MNKIAFYLMNSKGFYVLKLFGVLSIEYIVSNKGKNFMFLYI